MAYEKVVLKIPQQGILSVNTPPVVALVGDPVRAVMMHDFFWLMKSKEWVNRDVLRIPPSRAGVNSHAFPGSQIYGYLLIGNWIKVWETLYDNHPDYDPLFTDAENTANRRKNWWY